MSERLITIDTTDNPHAADLAKIVLEQAGIVSYLDNRNIVEMDWLLSNPVGNIRVQVAESDVERGTQILADHRELRNQWNDSMSIDQGEMRCLACGETMDDEAETCTACGWSYTDSDVPAPE